MSSGQRYFKLQEYIRDTGGDEPGAAFDEDEFATLIEAVLASTSDDDAARSETLGVAAAYSVPALRCLLAAGFDPRLPNTKSNAALPNATALHEAARHLNDEAIRVLVEEAGVEVDILCSGISPLLAIFYRGKKSSSDDERAAMVATANLLIDLGADPMVGPMAKSAVSVAIYCGCNDFVLSVIDAAVASGDGIPADRVDPILEQAVKRGAVSVLEALVDPARGALDVASAGRGGNLLTRAADPEVPTEVARILVDSGCTVNAANEHCGLPLHRAVLNTRADLVRLLIDAGADIRAQWRYGNTTLGSIPYLNSNRDEDNADQKAAVAEILGILGNAGYDRLIGEVVHQRSLLAWLLVVGYTEAALVVIDQAGEGWAEAADERGRTPLHEVCAANLVSAVEFLVAHGANVDAADCDGRTPLHWAVEGGCAAAVTALVAAGADTSVEDNDGRAPLAIAESFENRELIGALTGEELAPLVAVDPVQLKTVFVGDGATGKTSSLIVMTSHKFPGEYIPTVFENYVTDVSVGGKWASLGLWDTAMREDGMRLFPLYLPGTRVFVFCYSVANPASLANLRDTWFPIIEEHMPDPPRILVGLKADLRHDPYTRDRLEEKGSGFVTAEDVAAVAEHIGAVATLEVSSLENRGIQLLKKMVVEIGINHVEGPPARRKKACGIM